MNILILGSPGGLVDRLTELFRAENHCVSVVTGARRRRKTTGRAFEYYDFPYDSERLSEIVDSAAPDVTVFLGALDGCFRPGGARGAVLLSAGLMNALTACAARDRGRFVFLSSEAVFAGGRSRALTEADEPDAADAFGQALIQAEALCGRFRRGLETVVLRVGGCALLPRSPDETRDALPRMALEALRGGPVIAREGRRAAPLDETETARRVVRLALAPSPVRALYHVAVRALPEPALAKMVALEVERYSGARGSVEVRPAAGEQPALLDGRLFDASFGASGSTGPESAVKSVMARMAERGDVFRAEEGRRPPLRDRLKEKAGWLLRGLIPPLENLAGFALAQALAGRLGTRFAGLDIYLLYVLLFAAVYGHRQALLAAGLSAAGYLMRPGGTAAFSESGTYFYLAQLFLVGLVAGFLKDELARQRDESRSGQARLIEELEDIRALDDDNARARKALELQLINQKDSLGRLDAMTAALDADSPDEVLRRAADMLRDLMGGEAAVYRMQGGVPALCAATSEEARALGEAPVLGGALDACVREGRVYVNRQLEPGLPAMACAAGEAGVASALAVIWSLPIEAMGLAQADRLAVACRLIHRAVCRAERLQAALREGKAGEACPKTPGKS